MILWSVGYIYFYASILCLMRSAIRGEAFWPVEIETVCEAVGFFDILCLKNHKRGISSLSLHHVKSVKKFLVHHHRLVLVDHFLDFQSSIMNLVMAPVLPANLHLSGAVY